VVEDQVLVRAYAALADPTRRRLLETLRADDARNIAVLESAGLVRLRCEGLLVGTCRCHGDTPAPQAAHTMTNAPGIVFDEWLRLDRAFPHAPRRIR
jgi:hypothetical protein